jgi:two-component system, OmpR family, response regulator
LRVSFDRHDAMNILLIEDDPKTALYVTEGLAKHGYGVRWAATGTEALYQARTGHYDMLIVDRMLPNLDGLSVVTMLRDEGAVVPMLMLTTMDGLTDRVEGLNAGADDYLTKPFALSELLARLNALIRRTQRLGGRAQTKLRVGALELDLLERTVTREGRAVDLQNQEFKLLEYLIQNAGRIVTRAMLLEHIWDVTFNPGTNVVESHISRLRSKVDRGYSREMIRTVRGAGYVLDAD